MLWRTYHILDGRPDEVQRLHRRRRPRDARLALEETARELAKEPLLVQRPQARDLVRKEEVSNVFVTLRTSQSLHLSLDGKHLPGR